MLRGAHLLILGCAIVGSSSGRFKRQLPCGELNEFRCTTGECIPQHQVCDTFVNCKDRSDENPLVCNKFGDDCLVSKVAEGTVYKKVPCTGNCGPTRVQVSCQDGYAFPTTTNSTLEMECPSTTWNNEVSQCIKCGQPVTSANRRSNLLLGTFETQAAKHPWHVAIFNNSVNLCGGTLISVEIVLTAASCFFNPNGIPPDEKEYRVIAGKYTYGFGLETVSQMREVKKIIMPPSFQGEIASYAANIALVKTVGSFKLSMYIQLACLHTIQKGVFFPDSIVTVAGWGLKLKGDYEKNLQEGHYETTNIRLCQKRTNLITQIRFFSYDKFCILLKNEDSSGFLPTETGNGVIFNSNGINYVYGVVSAKIVEQTTFAIVTNVSKHLNWIRQQIDTNSATDLSCPDHSKRCSIGGCVKNELFCNGKEDCADGSDENPDHCSLSNPTPRSPSPTLQADPKTSCNLVNHPGNNYAIQTCTDGSKTLSGDSVAQNCVVQINCKDGYDVEPNSPKVHACLFGSFYPPLSKCEKLCPPLSSESLELTCFHKGIQIPCDKPVLPRTRVEYQCKSKYKYDESRPNLFRSRSTCTDFGDWDYELPSCVPECGVVNARNTADALISYGTEVTDGQYPWHVGIYEAKNESYLQICGGTILSSTYIISAAHCFWKGVDATGRPITFAENYKVVAGKYYRDYARVDRHMQPRDVRNINMNSQYADAGQSFANDIALVKVVSPFTFDNFVLPVCINYSWRENFIPDPGTSGTVVGWGLTEKKEYSEVLLEARMPYVDLSSCRIKYRNQDFFRFLTYDKFCVTYLRESGTQKGDSGGGFTIVLGGRHYILGIVSVKPAGLDKYAAFTNIPVYRNWLREALLES